MQTNLQKGLICGMTWEQFLGDKQVADVILREAIGENPVFGLEQYGITNPTDAQIERAAIMEENGASEEEIRATLQNWEAIFEGKDGSLGIVRFLDKNNTVFIKLEKSGDYYKVTTAIPARNDFFKNKKRLAERAQSNQSLTRFPSAFSGTSLGDNITQENENVKLFSRAPMTEAEIEKEWEATFGNASVEDVKNNVIVNDFEKQTYENKIASGMSEKQAILETNDESIVRDSTRLNTEDTLPQNDNTAFESPVNETPVATNPTYRTPRRMGYLRNQGAYTPVSRIIELAKVHTPGTFLHEVSHNFFINYFDAIERIADK